MIKVAWQLGFVLFAVAAAALPGDQDPMALLERSISRDSENRQRSSSYLYSEDVTQRVLTESGTAVETSSASYEVIYLENQPYYKLTGRNGSPLSPSEQEAEERRMEAVAAERRSLGQTSAASSERPRITVRYSRIPDLHKVRYLGEEKVSGYDTYVLEAYPKSRRRPTDLGDLETHAMRIRLWLEKESLLRVKMEVEVLRDAGRLRKGSKVWYWYAQQQDSVWLVQKIVLRRPFKGPGQARWAETEQVYSRYRKFQAESKVTVSDELP
jgi:hypothetical protein